MVDRWAGSSLTRRPKGRFAVARPRQLGERNVIIITVVELKTYLQKNFFFDVITISIRPGLDVKTNVRLQLASKTAFRVAWHLN